MENDLSPIKHMLAQKQAIGDQKDQDEASTYLLVQSA